MLKTCQNSNIPYFSNIKNEILKIIETINKKIEFDEFQSQENIKTCKDIITITQQSLPENLWTNLKFELKKISSWKFYFGEISDFISALKKIIQSYSEVNLLKDLYQLTIENNSNLFEEKSAFQQQINRETLLMDQIKTNYFQLKEKFEQSEQSQLYEKYQAVATQLDELKEHYETSCTENHELQNKVEMYSATVEQLTAALTDETSKRSLLQKTLDKHSQEIVELKDFVKQLLVYPERSHELAKQNFSSSI